MDFKNVLSDLKVRLTKEIKIEVKHLPTDWVKIEEGKPVKIPITSMDDGHLKGALITVNKRKAENADRKKTLSRQIDIIAKEISDIEKKDKMMMYVGEALLNEINNRGIVFVDEKIIK